jgi:hypothetical protein
VPAVSSPDFGRRFPRENQLGDQCRHVANRNALVFSKRFRSTPSKAEHQAIAVFLMCYKNENIL